MNCPTCENKVNNWIISSRKHKRPPRIFVICPHCGDEWQSTPNTNGKIDHVFKTGRESQGLKQRNYRLTDAGDREVRRRIASGELR